MSEIEEHEIQKLTKNESEQDLIDFYKNAQFFEEDELSLEEELNEDEISR